jgi:hypothetical protein
MAAVQPEPWLRALITTTTTNNNNNNYISTEFACRPKLELKRGICFSFTAVL